MRRFFTAAAWVFGLLPDASLPFEPKGFLYLRVLLPILVMGAFILTAIDSHKKEKEGK